MKMKTLLIAGMTFALGFGLSNIAMSNNVSKIAIVDVNTVVAQSKQVEALKKEQQAKVTELQKWLKNVKTDIDKQQTKEGKEKLAKKYNTDYAAKQEAIRKNYQTKLLAIDKNITSIVAKEAQAQGFDIVLSKSAVVYGGTDITSAIAKAVK